jgi:hypothetical protein
MCDDCLHRMGWVGRLLPQWLVTRQDVVRQSQKEVDMQKPQHLGFPRGPPPWY